MEDNKIAIMIPCFNEELTIKKVINDFQRELPQASIYVYDNNSTDATYSIAVEEGAIVKKEPRQGKGNVIRQMF
ncbi:glycosyltransferase, partial [Enterococcus cecorum]